MKIFDWLRKTRKKKKDLASAEEYAEIISLDNALNQEKEEKGDIYRILQEERIYIAEHQSTQYDFFGFFGMIEDEMPFFKTVGDRMGGSSGQEFEVSESFYPFTPRLLAHCVNNLTAEARQKEASDIDGFREKCKMYAQSAIYQEGWDSMIDELANSLTHSKKIDSEKPKSL